VTALARGGVALHDVFTGTLRVLDAQGTLTANDALPLRYPRKLEFSEDWLGLSPSTGSFSAVSGTFVYEAERSFAAYFTTTPGNLQGQWAPRVLAVTGILVKSHTIVVGPYRHLSIRIVPYDQERWRNLRPADFGNLDAYGKWYATIGAGPPDGDISTFCATNSTLVSKVNREADVGEVPDWLERLQYMPLQEDEIIERLFAFDINYSDDLVYECFPDAGTNEYNSNSYVSGLLGAAGLPLPEEPSRNLWRYPGWTKPVPGPEFEPTP